MTMLNNLLHKLIVFFAVWVIAYSSVLSAGNNLFVQDQDNTARSHNNISSRKLLPLELKPDWWSEYEKSTPEDLPQKIERLKKRLLYIKSPYRAVMYVRELSTLLESYLFKRSSISHLLNENISNDSRYTIEDMFDLKKKIDIIASKITIKENHLEKRDEIAAKLKQSEYRLQRLYIEKKKDTTEKLLIGLQWMISKLKLSIALLDNKINQQIQNSMMQQFEIYIKEFEKVRQELKLSKDITKKAKNNLVVYGNKLNEDLKELGRLEKAFNHLPGSGIEGALETLRLIKQRIQVKRDIVLLAYERTLTDISKLQSSSSKEIFGEIYTRYDKTKDQLEEISDWMEDNSDQIREEKSLFDTQMSLFGENNFTQQAVEKYGKLLSDLLYTEKFLNGDLEKAKILSGTLREKLIAHSSFFQMFKEKSLTKINHLWVSLFLWMDETLFEINHTPVTAWGLLGFAITLLVGWLIARIISALILRLIPKKRVHSLSSVNTIKNIIKIIVFGFIFLFALSDLGIDITKLTILISALSIGIGFGLQTIISNFVSGIILIFEKSIKLGDYIELSDDTRGVVKEINIRSTIVNTYDNIDIVVPNSQFINTNVVNLTMRDKIIRAKIPFGVAYSSDIDKVRELVLKAALELPYTLDMEPYMPQVWLRSFGDSSLECELVVWIKPKFISKIGSVKSKYAETILSILRENDIVIPFPQREVRIIGE